MSNAAIVVKVPSHIVNELIFYHSRWVARLQTDAFSKQFMGSLMKQSTLWWLVQFPCWALGGLFLFAGWQKVQEPAQFLTSIRGFHLVPDPYAAWLALALPWLEIFAGLAVITGFLRRGGLLILNTSLVIFIAALASAWARGINVDCGCFGKVKTGGLLQELGLDTLLLAIGIWLQCRIAKSANLSRCWSMKFQHVFSHPPK